MENTYPLVRAERVVRLVELLAGLELLTLAVHTSEVVDVAGCYIGEYIPLPAVG